MKLVVVILSICFFSSCVYTDGLSKKHTLFLKKVGSEFDVLVKGGEVVDLHKGNLTRVTLEPAGQGTTYLFGLIKIREKIANNYKRVYIAQKNEIIRQYSVNEIFLMDSYLFKDSLKVYILPEIN